MFGFGMSSRDKWHLNQVELMIAPFATLSGENIKDMARQQFDHVKKDVVGKRGELAYAIDFGDKLIATKKDAVEKRLAAGLSLDDIRNYWNQTPLLNALRISIIEMSEFSHFYAAKSRGEDLDDLARHMRKTEPRWGDPETWNQDLPVNKGFTHADADLYIEFFVRVGKWQEKTSHEDINILLEKYTSYNAMIRDLVRKNII